MKVNSDKKQINSSIDKVFAKISNFDLLRPIAEQGEVNGFSLEVLSADTCLLKTGIAGDVELHITERVAPERIVLRPQSSPVNGALSLLLSSCGEEETDLQVAVDVDIPFFARAMAEKPLTEAVGKLAELLSAINYN